MKYPSIVATPEGGSRFENVDVDLKPVAFVPGNPPVDVSAPRTASAVQFAVFAPDWDGSWHPTPRRQYGVLLAGEVELTTTDGESRRFGPGSVALLDDTVGKGHNTRVISRSPASILFVAIP